jgi:hypothetical protein
LRQHLERASEQLGEPHEELAGPECPEHLEYVWGWFCDLHQACGSNGFGSNPIGFLDIYAWSHLTGVSPTPFEVGCIRRLDGVYLQALSEK